MSNLQKPGDDDAAEQAEIRGHAWWPERDYPNQRDIWRCTCKEFVIQPFGAPVPDELISHPQSFGQMRGEPN